MRRNDNKREQRKRLFMSLFIVAIMTLSVLGYMIGRGSEETTKYNNFRFNKANNKWVTKIDKRDVRFDYFPSSVEDINITGEIINKIKNSIQMDVTSDVDSEFKEQISLFQFELAYALSVTGQFIRRGFTSENEFNISVITCENATEYIPVLMFEKTNKTEVYREDNCIIISAKTESDFTALKDRILYGIFGIIKIQ